jgi:mRNA interferase RelE/StbE
VSLEVVIKEDLYQFMRRLAPEPRRAMRRALKELRQEKGDIRALDQSLTGYYRLRVGKFRVIFRYRDGNTIDAFYAAERGIVYEVFEELFAKRLRS